MARKGSNIYKRKDGRYEGRVPIGYKEDGKLKYKSVYDRTLSGVKEKMTQFYTVRQERTVSNLKLTVRDAAEQWLAAAKLPSDDPEMLAVEADYAARANRYME